MEKRNGPSEFKQCRRSMLESYRGIAPQGDLVLLRKLGDRLAGRSFLHINSTRAGGGVAEILQRMIPMLKALVEFRKDGHWIWRCHIDVSNPVKGVCDALTTYCRQYDAAIFSVAKFSSAFGIDEFIIPPSFDPLSDKTVLPGAAGGQ